MDKRLLDLTVRNFKSLRDVRVPLGDLTVLVGPNNAGKSNFLEVFNFLADIIRTDLQPALDFRGGFDEVIFRGKPRTPTFIHIELTATWTQYSSLGAPDDYSLRIARRGKSLHRSESFAFKRRQGRGRRITISGERITIEDQARDESVETEKSVGIQKLASGLSLLPRLSSDEGGEEVAAVADRLASFKVFDVNVESARLPSGRSHLVDGLNWDARNLAGFLFDLSEQNPTAFDRLQDDARSVLPNLESIEFEFPRGNERTIYVLLKESGLRRPTSLREASYGTVRLLGLLALFYDLTPPALTCIEEIDHGLHPQALELIVERLREASQRSQFIIATHSPALADRLRPDELVVCERAPDGSSVIPAVTREEMERIVAASEGLPLGELWFSGALGGSL